MAEKEAGRLHMAFVCRLYRKQHARGGLFLHKQPAYNDSWSEACVREVLALQGVGRMVADQCQYGQATEDGEPIMKPTGFMSNCPSILARLSSRCTGRGGICSRPAGGRHRHCRGKVARRAAIFQKELCEAILRGLRDHMRLALRMRPGELGCVDATGVMVDADEEVARHAPEHYLGLLGSELGWAPLADDDSPGEGELYTTTADGTPPMSKPRAGDDRNSSEILKVSRHNRYVDDLTGQPLPPDLCNKARAEELRYFEEKGVWAIRRINECLRRTGKPPITVRWVETNKGDDDNPRIRSRLVAREIRLPGEEAIFAPTPPLESLRVVLSHAVTNMPGEPQKDWRPESPNRQQILLVDISRAYFNARTGDGDPVYVDLPPELGAPEGSCGLLKRHMYGSRRAAEGWQDEYSAYLRQLGFV